MAAFPRIPVGDLIAAGEAELKTGPFGTQLKASEYTEEGTTVINVRNIGMGSIKADKLEFISDATRDRLSSHLLRSGDIVFGRKGAVERHVFIRKEQDGWFQGSDCLRLRFNSPRVLPLFASYFFITEEHQRWMMNQCSHGATMSSLNQDILERIDLPLPPMPVQRRIAGILSAYDELMENSQRRIRLLEAMARALYREWFVHFRFPGHEKHPRAASPLGDIPQGWEATTLGEHLAALESGKRPKGGIRKEAEGVPSIGAENINGIGRHEFASEKLIPRAFFEQMRKGLVRDRDVALYKDGAYIGKSSYFRDGFPHSECCVNEHVFLLRSDGVRLKQSSLYLWLQEPDTVQTIRSKNANAAQPGINLQTVGGLELVLPDEKTAAHFDRLVEPLLAELINLAKQIQVLRRTRDLLLPRLLSGRVQIPNSN